MLSDGVHEYTYAEEMQVDWDDVRHFLALGRLGSVRAAGKKLGVSHSTVARRVEALEARLGTRLFDRSQDGWALTPAGQQMVAGAERVEREMADLERVLAGQDDRLAGAIALTCGDPFVAGMLLESLRDLCADNPEIELHVTVDGRPFDLSRREADVAVRALVTGVDPPEYLLGARVAPLLLAGYVAVAHADRLDPARPDTPARWLAFEDRRVVERIIADSGYPQLPAWGSFSSLDAILGAARSGLGLVFLPVYVGDADPSLRRLEAGEPRHLADLWLLSHPDLRHTRRVQAVRGAVARMFRERAPLFRGEMPVGFRIPAS